MGTKILNPLNSWDWTTLMILNERNKLYNKQVFCKHHQYFIKNTTQNYSLFSIGVSLSKTFKNDSKFTIFDRGYPIENVKKCLKIHYFSYWLPYWKCKQQQKNNYRYNWPFSIGVNLSKILKSNWKFINFGRSCPYLPYPKYWKLLYRGYPEKSH